MKLKFTKRKRLIASLLAAAMIFSSAALPVFAETATDTGTGSVTSTIPVNGSISALTISVTHPVQVAYAIDANGGATGSFSSPAIAITNNTTAPVNVTVQSLTSATGGSIQFTDKLPGDEDWASLNNADSKKYLALGIGITDGSGWNSGYVTSTDWAAANTSVEFGSLDTAATGNFQFTADYGHAFDQAYTANHSLVFMFDLV